MKLSNKILMGILAVVILFQLFTMAKVRSMIKDSMYENSSISKSIFYDLMASDVVEKDYSYEDFDKLKLDLTGNVIIKKSNDYKITVKAPSEFLESEYFEIEKNGNELSVECPMFKNNHYEIYTIIEMPELKRLKGAMDVDIRLDGFKEKDMKIQLSGDCVLEGINNNIDNLDLDLFGETEVNFFNSIVKDAEVNAFGESDVEMELTNLKINALGETDLDLRINDGELKGSTIGEFSLTYNGSLKNNNIKHIGSKKVTMNNN